MYLDDLIPVTKTNELDLSHFVILTKFELKLQQHNGSLIDSNSSFTMVIHSTHLINSFAIMAVYFLRTKSFYIINSYPVHHLSLK